MTEGDIIDVTAKMMLLVLYLSMPPIIAAALIGTLVSLIQALTQVQEQTLSFAFKLIAVIIVIFLVARWQGGELYNYSRQIFMSIPLIAS